jgi:hypothetical protein
VDKQKYDIYASTLDLMQRNDQGNPQGMYVQVDHQFTPSGPFAECKKLVEGLKTYLMRQECLALISYYCLYWRFKN